MKRFLFALEGALRWRQRRLEQEESRLRSLAAERDALRERIRQIGEARRGAERELLGQASIPAEDLAALEAYRLRLARERARLEQAEADCEGRLAAQRERVLEARRDVRVIEKLRERRLAEWQAEADRELEGLAAEVFLARWGRR
jgi:flagellar FliJ protein